MPRGRSKSRIRAKRGPKTKYRLRRVIDGYWYEFDRTYETLKGAQRRVKGTKRKIVKVAGSVWETYRSLGRKA